MVPLFLKMKSQDSHLGLGESKVEGETSLVLRSAFAFRERSCLNPEVPITSDDSYQQHHNSHAQGVT